jgi:exoribonuclease-2
MGVAQYTWATSPLRRYVDLVNQWQIIACARHGKTAALAAPFKPRDAALFSVISAFDAAYGAYNDFQNGIERWWTLRWLEQHGVAEIDAAVMAGGLVRADTLPLVFRLPGTESLPRHSRVRARITGIDGLTLELHAVLAARLDEPGATETGAETGDAGDATDDSELDDEAGPLSLAIVLDDPAAADASPDQPAAAG